MFLYQLYVVQLNIFNGKQVPRKTTVSFMFVIKLTKSTMRNQIKQITKQEIVPLKKRTKQILNFCLTPDCGVLHNHMFYDEMFVKNKQLFK